MANNVNVLHTEMLSEEKYPLSKVSYTREKAKGGTEQKESLVFNPGNASTILLYNRVRKMVLLTRQFRLPSFLNGNTSGMLLETCAGKIEGESPEEAIVREVQEEMGYRIGQVQKLFQLYMTPGTVTELLHFFVAPYELENKVSEGGGLPEEQEDVEVVEMDFDQAFTMIKNGEIQDAKTVLLLLYAQVQGYFL